MTIDLSKIQNPVRDGLHCVRGSLSVLPQCGQPPIPVVVVRCLDEFKVMLNVTVGGQRVHYSEFEPDEKDAFYALQQRAFEREDRAASVQRVKVIEACKSSGLFAAYQSPSA